MSTTTANPIAAVNWNRLTVPVPRRCCDSARVRQAATRAFAALAILSATLYFTAIPLSAVAALTTTLAITAIALSRLKPSPNDPEVLLQQRQNLGAKIQKNPGLRASQMLALCPNPKSLTNEEINLLIRHDAQTMEYAAFMNKHGDMLPIFDAANLAILKPKFIEAAIKEEGSTPEQVLRLSESFRFSVKNEDLLTLLSLQVQEAPSYTGFFNTYEIHWLATLKPIDLWYLRPTFIESLIAEQVNKKHMSLKEVLALPESKCFNLKKEEIAPHIAKVQIALHQAKDGKYKDFEFELIEFTDTSDKKYIQVKYLDYVPTLKCGLLEYEERKEELRVMGPKVVQMVRKSILSEERLDFMTDAHNYFVLKSRNGLNHIRTMFSNMPELVQKAREQFFSESMGSLSYVLTNPAYEEDRVFLGITAKDVKEALDKQWGKSILTDLKGFLATTGKEKDFSPRAWTQKVLKVIEEEDWAVVDLGIFYPELFKTGILIASDVFAGQPLQKRLAYEIEEFNTFEEIINNVPDVLFKKEILNRENPHLSSLVKKFVLDHPNIYLYQSEKSEQSAFIDKFHLMSDVLADHVQIMQKKYQDRKVGDETISKLAQEFATLPA